MNITHRLQMDINQNGEILWRVLWYYKELWWNSREPIHNSKYSNPRYLVFPKKTDLRSAVLREKNKNQKMSTEIDILCHKFSVLQEDVWYLENRINEDDPDH